MLKTIRSCSRTRSSKLNWLASAAAALVTLPRHPASLPVYTANRRPRVAKTWPFFGDGSLPLGRKASSPSSELTATCTLVRLAWMAWGLVLNSKRELYRHDSPSMAIPTREQPSLARSPLPKGRPLADPENLPTPACLTDRVLYLNCTCPSMSQAGLRSTRATKAAAFSVDAEPRQHPPTKLCSATRSLLQYRHAIDNAGSRRNVCHTI